VEPRKGSEAIGFVLAIEETRTSDRFHAVERTRTSKTSHF
jgi:hypothetical protein